MVRRIAGLLLTTAALSAAAPSAGHEAEASFALPDLDGVPRSIEPGSRASPLLLQFFATWCPSCRSELPRLDRWLQGCPHVRLILINLDEGSATVRRWLAPLGLHAPVVLDAGGRRWRSAGLRGLPATLIGAGGATIAHEGEMTTQTWRDLLAGIDCKIPPTDDD